jgi:hypothetical protein
LFCSARRIFLLVLKVVDSHPWSLEWPRDAVVTFSKRDMVGVTGINNTAVLRRSWQGSKVEETRRYDKVAV